MKEGRTCRRRRKEGELEDAKKDGELEDETREGRRTT